MSRSLKVIFIVAVSGALISCTNNQWFLSTLYNRIDNTIYSEMMNYADFNHAQKAAIKDLAKRFHHWHRTTQLPRYAEFLEDLSLRARSGNAVSLQEIENWSLQIRAFIHDVTDCHPLIPGTEIMLTLTDAQVEQVAAQSRKEYEKYLIRDQKKTAEERLEDRYRRSIRWLKRFGLSLDESERQRLRDTLQAEPKLREQSFALWGAWDQAFYQLLLQRSEEGFDELMQSHVLSLKTVLEDAQPEEVAYKLDLWTGFFHVIAQSEFDEDSQGFPKWADKMSENLRVISENVPKKQQGWDASAYCQVGAG